MTRMEFYRRIELPAQLTFVVSVIVWIFIFARGNTLGGNVLSMRAFIVGATIGLLSGIVFGLKYIKVLPGLMGPVKRFVLFCLFTFVLGGLFAAASGLALNRFAPADPPSVQTFVLSSSYEIKGGWSAKFIDTKGNEYEHTFGHSFGPVPNGTSFEFIVQNGYFGFPYFHSYRRAPSDR